MGNEKEYLVRGALLRCDCGTHLRRVNLPKCHGVYVNEHPVIRESDYIPEKNVTFFGVCANSPQGAPTVVVQDVFDDKGNQIGVAATGSKCMPTIVEPWKNPHPTTKIKGTEKAVTMDSFLVCKFGGLIQPVTSGQEYKD